MHLLHLPKLGYTMENGAITDWLVPEGTAFDVGTPLYEVETEKNVVQVEARLPGTLVRVVAERDSELGVGGLVAVVADPGEEPSGDDIAALIDSEGGGHDAGGASGGASASASADPAVDDTAQLDAPAEGPAALAAPPSGRVRALPKVRAAAERLGVDLATVAGTGPRGTLTVDDVERAAAAAAGGASGTGAGSPFAEGGPAVLESRAQTGVQKAMATGVSKSWAEVPQFVQQLSIDLTAVTAYRAEKKAAGERIGLTAVLLSAIAHAIAEVPVVNSTLSGTTITVFDDVNVAVAVNSDRGLVVPTVGGVQAAGLRVVDDAVQSVVEKARAGSLPTDVVPTITLSNLGGYGVENGIPLITTPQAAIVFAGDVQDRPVVVDGSVVVRPMLGIAVAYDHRIVDGATGGEFCRALRDALEHPERLEQPARAS